MKFPQWLRNAAGSALTAVALTSMPVADAQSVLSEPDFSGMNTPTGFFQLMARDDAHGWNYVLGGTTTHINGVQVGTLSRVNDFGQLDLSWTGELAQQFFRGSLLLGNGELMFREGLLGAPPWQRLRQGSNRGFVREAFRWTHEALLQDNTATTARDREGNTYAVFQRQSDNGAALATLRRVTSEGVPDAVWRLDIDATSSAITQLAISADGSVLYVASRTEGTTVTNTLGRASASDTMRWTAPFGGTVAALATDDVGRAYLFGDKVALQGSTGTLLRVDRTGNLDAGWMRFFEPAALTNLSALRVLDDRAVVVTSSADAQPLVRLISLADGSILSSRVVPTGSTPRLVGAGGTVVIGGDSKLTLLSPTATDFTARDVAIKTGNAPSIASIKRWGAGYVVGGNFEYMHNAIRYANLMRLGADLKPDPTWQHGVTGIVNALAIDRDGGLIVGGERLLDLTSSLIRFGPEGQLDPRWRKSFNGAVSTVAAGLDGDVFAGGLFGKVDDVNVPSIARFRADGALQGGWAQSVPWSQQPGAVFGGLTGDGVKKIIDASDAGVVVWWQRTTGIFGFPIPKLSRFSRTNDGAILPNPAGLDAISPTTVIQDMSSGQVFGTRSSPGSTTLVRLLPGSLEIDPMWLPPTVEASVTTLSNSHLYLANGRRMLRSANSATLDPGWTLGSRSISGWLDTDTPGDALTWSGQDGAPVAIRAPSPAIVQRTVVEYFAKNIQRFFITARVTEQQSLDAMPTVFARTGMQFGAFDEAATPGSSAGALPICRFYAPPTRGGSNTHFYGRRTDCQLLNTYPEVINEGYDFAAPQPAASNGVCPANAPLPVYRMFNNQSASNNSNHRYVVSLARIEEMKARGWVDEGVVFCATAAADSQAFGQW